MSTSRITLYIAASVDGYIADDEGGVEWLNEFEQDSENDDIAADYEEFFDAIDCLVMGATTYEQILTFGEWPYEERPTYVFTHRELPRATDAVEFVDEPVAAVATELRQEYDHIWVVGGAQLARAFFAEHQLDELRLSVIPVLLGSGTQLFLDGGEDSRLQHLDTKTYSSGIVELQYALVT